MQETRVSHTNQAAPAPAPLPTEQDKNDALFFDAVLKGNMKQAQFYLDRGADVYKPSGAHTPLRAAVLQGQQHMVQWLVEQQRVDVAKDERVLHIIALSESPSKDMFNYLVSKGGRVEQEDSKLGRPLTLALQGKKEEFARWLIEVHHAETDYVTAGMEVTTPLHKACGFCSVDMVRYIASREGMLKHFRTLDMQQCTPLMTAVQQKQDQVVSLLLTEYRQYVDPDFMASSSALFMAVQDGYVPTTRALLEGGANPNLRHAELGVTPLHIAASNDHTFAVKLLLEHGAEVDPTNAPGYTPLTMACSQGYLETPVLLLNARANINHAADRDGSTPLHQAVMGGHIDCARLLLKAGANKDVVDKEGQTPEQIVAEGYERNKDNFGARIFLNLLQTANEPQRNKCGYCFAALDQSKKRCGRCKAMWYCTAECQKKHWSQMHKHQCKPAQGE